MLEKELDPLIALDQVPTLLFALKDKDGRYVFANKSIRTQFRVDSNDQVRGLFNKDLLPASVDASLGPLDLQDRAVLSKQETADVLYAFRESGSRLNIFLGSKSPYRDNEGNCIGIIGKSMLIKEGHLRRLGMLLFSDSLRFSSKASLAFDLVDEPYQCNDLSKRESECLFFLLRGKTMKEIGCYLNISVKTVDYYLQQLRIKFDCHTRSQLVEKALACGLLFFVPKSLTNLYPKI